MAGHRSLRLRSTPNFGAGPFRSILIVSLPNVGCAGRDRECVGCINWLFRAALAPSLRGYYGQLDARAVVRLMVNAHVRRAHFRQNDLRFASLRVAGKMREESAGNLDADLVAGAKDIAGQHAIEREFVNL